MILQISIRYIDVSNLRSFYFLSYIFFRFVLFSFLFSVFLYFLYLSVIIANNNLVIIIKNTLFYFKLSYVCLETCRFRKDELETITLQTLELYFYMF